MNRSLLYSFLILLFTATASLSFPEKKITIWLLGDSTVCDQLLDRAPVTGWGTPFANYFDASVEVKNRARGGRSTRTFISEGRWKNVADSLLAGDYVLIQFGHNDEAKEPQYKDRYTPVTAYKKNLEKFINETQARKAFPVLITPVTRMRFDRNGNALQTHKEYTEAVWEVGKKMGIPVVDLDAMSRSLLQQLGPHQSKFLFLFLDSLQNPHYPNGREDRTHFNEYGARRMAELVLSEIKRQQLPLAGRITKKAAP